MNNYYLLQYKKNTDYLILYICDAMDIPSRIANTRGRYQSRGREILFIYNCAPPYTTKKRFKRLKLKKTYKFLLLSREIIIYTELPIIDFRLFIYLESIFAIILPSLSPMSRFGTFLNFEKRAYFLGNPVREYLS